MSPLKRSPSVPLALVPALAALVACDSDKPKTISGVDPCLPQVYNEKLCETAVKQQGYHHNGTFYHHAYLMPMLFYNNGYSRYVASGGRVRAINPTAYSPNYVGNTRARTTVVRGGFGNIGGTRGFGGS